MKLDSITLPTFLKRENLDIKNYDALVLDTQGSEILDTARGSDVLPEFRYVKLEVPDFEAYKGCCKADEMTQFMQGHGFSVMHRNAFAASPLGGTYYDIVYRNSRRMN